VVSDTINCYAIMDLCRQGTLLARIQSQTQLEEYDAKFIFKQIVRTFAYVHGEGVAHRDIKPENILLSPGNRVKIIDFGLSTQTDGGLLCNSMGSLLYAAPETLAGEAFDGFKADIWSCGILLCVMLLGRVPWTKKRPQHLFREILQGNCSFDREELSQEAFDFLSRILKKDPNERMTWEQMLEHDWLREVQDPSHIFRRESLPASFGSLIHLPTASSVGGKALIAMGRSVMKGFPTILVPQLKRASQPTLCME
jgi:serine/threonine protein kinase